MEDQLFGSNESREHYVHIGESILGDKRLTLGDKVVYARVVGFEDGYYESADSAAEFLGVAKKTVLRALKKLESLGLIVVAGVKNNCKVYVKAPTEMQRRAIFLSSKCGQKVLKCGQNVHAVWTKCPPIIKENKETKVILSKERISQDDSLQVEEKAEKQEFGNHDLNEAVKLWEEATGFDYSTNAFERRTIYNLTRRKDVRALGGYEKLCELVKNARHMDNQFAPKIVKPSELGGKYSKLDKLIDWAKRSEEGSTQKTNAKGNKFTRPLTECEDALIRSYFKPCPYVRSPKADDGPTDEDIEKAVGGGEQESKWDANAPDFYQKMREIAFSKLNKKKGDSNEAK